MLSILTILTGLILGVEDYIPDSLQHPAFEV